MYNTIAQAIGFVGFFASIISFQSSDAKKLYLIQMLMKAAFAVHFFMLGGFAGAFLNVIGIINCILYYIKCGDEKFLQKYKPVYWFMALYLAMGIITVLLTQRIIELLPTIASLAVALMFNSGNVQRIRCYQICIISPCWMVYNVLMSSYSGIATEMFNIVSVLIGLYRFRNVGKMLTVRAAAKINLVLSVFARRGDGYHDIMSVMQSVGLYDDIVIKKDKRISVSSNLAPAGEDNICFRAAEMFSDYGGANIRIEKGIPMAAGLGGGSADAAATLLGLNRLYGNPFTDSRLEEMALSLGADVPFFLNGSTALVEGKGEKLTKVKSKSLDIVIIKHGQKQSTKEMYEKLDEAGLVDRRDDVKAFAEALSSGDSAKISQGLFNDFEKVCDCTDIKKELISHGAKGACLSGSGPSVFGLFEDEQTAAACYEELKDKYDSVFLCKTAPYAIEIE